MFKSVIFIILIGAMNLNAQDLSKHQWKDRLVLIIAEDENNEKFQKQLTELQRNTSGLKDRKLTIYQILPKKNSAGFQDKTWKNSTELYKRYKAKDGDFRVLLIGLDGGKKLDQSEVLSAKKLFKTIDSMPMRQSEIRQNPNNGY